MDGTGKKIITYVLTTSCFDYTCKITFVVFTCKVNLELDNKFINEII